MEIRGSLVVCCGFTPRNVGSSAKIALFSFVCEILIRDFWVKENFAKKLGTAVRPTFVNCFFLFCLSLLEKKVCVKENF